MINQPKYWDGPHLGRKLLHITIKCYQFAKIMICFRIKLKLKLYMIQWNFWESNSKYIWYTGHSRYVDSTYLDTTTYVEVIFHSQFFFSIFHCISTPSMSKTVIMKQQVSQGDFSCPRRVRKEHLSQRIFKLEYVVSKYMYMQVVVTMI